MNAYAVGALDALEKSKYTEMLEMLNEFYQSLSDDKYFLKMGIWWNLKTLFSSPIN